MSRTTRVLALTGVAVVAVAQAFTAGSAGAAPKASASRYVTAVPSCSTKVKAGFSQCYAMRLQRTSSSTPGARQLSDSPNLAAGPAGGFTPADLAKAYGVTASASTTQVVGIVDAYDDPNAKADLNAFDAKYGLPAETSTSFKKVSQTGSTTTLPAGNAGWAGEISLDLDAVRGLCNKCKIVLVEATTNSNANLAVATNQAVTQGATIISNSYGGPESGTIPAATLAAYKHSGVVILASTGDNGMYEWDKVNDGSGTSAGAPEVPSSLNTVVAVGGTTMYLNSDATRSSETVWNENGNSDVTGNATSRAMGASGGGCSTQVTAQSWQSGVANYSQTTCGTKRLAADISALADPYTGFDIYDTYQSSGWQTFGGTSLASPLIGAMWALAGGSGGVAYPSMSLYGHFKSDTTKSLYDVTAGGNAFCGGTTPTSCTAYYGQGPNTFGLGFLDCSYKPNSATASAGTRACDAQTGYDGPSGVGTPIGLNAFKAMSPAAKVAAPASATHAKSATFSGASSSDPFPAGTIKSYAWTWGDGQTSTASSASSTHTFTSAGTYSVKLTVTDNYGRTGATTSSVTVK